MKCKLLIDPVLTDCSLILTNQEKFKNELIVNSEWTHSTTELIEIFEEFCSDPEGNVVEALLRTTSVLEHAMGNVYQTITNLPPPHLLKDLLQELAEVDDFFEKNQVSRSEFDCSKI